MHRAAAPALYDRIGRGYGAYRRPDPRIAERLARALGDARSVLNVGAGTGSYEPAGRRVLAVEPAITMIRQRAPDAAPVVRAHAGVLPVRDRGVDAAVAILTLHHWSDWRAGLREMVRVARRRVVLLTWDPWVGGFWLTDDYFPEIVVADRTLFPTTAQLADVLGPITVEAVPIPHDCTDGFLGAYWRRPHAYLDPRARAAISAFARLPSIEPGLQRLAADLASGAWQRKHGAVLSKDTLEIGYRLVRTG